MASEGSHACVTYTCDEAAGKNLMRIKKNVFKCTKLSSGNYIVCERKYVLGDLPFVSGMATLLQTKEKVVLSLFLYVLVGTS